MASQWGGALPPPPGVEPNFVDPPSQLPGTIALHTVCLTLVTFSVAMRQYTRIRITGNQMGIDDYLCIVSYFMTAAYSGLLLKSFSLGIGRHIWDTPAFWLVDALRYFTFSTYAYVALSGLVKLTLLFFYRRIFSPQTKAKYFINFGIASVVSLNTAILFGTIFSCIPVQRQWNSTVDGHCFNPIILPWVSGVSSSLTDIYVLVAPLPLLWGLNISRKRKLKLMAVFGLGLFACVASLVRLGMTPLLRSSLDATWNISRIAFWATIEVNVGIICACLSMLPAFLNRHFPDAGIPILSCLWSYTISFSLKRTRDTSKTREQDHSPGYENKANSESQHLYGLRTDNNILRTQDIIMESYPKATMGASTLKDFEAQKLGWKYEQIEKRN